MSIRNLEFLFKPKSIAVIGASRRPSSVGAVLAQNLLSSGFDGPVMPVNPKHRAVSGVLAYPDIASLPEVPDLAVIATPPRTVPGIVGELAERGTRGAVVITAGFGEIGEEGKWLQQQMLDAAKPHMLRIVGPNCLGILLPRIGLNASFSHLAPSIGGLAFVTQSGAIVTSILDWASPRGIGFSHLVSLGSMSDVDFGDMLDYLTNDQYTTGILLYVEGITNARKFMSAARAAARTKPVIVVKAGKHEASARAAASHTGALAGSDAVADAAFKRAGMLRVNSLEDLFSAAETLARSRPPRGDRLAILTNGGGMGVVATDALGDAGGQLAELSPETIAALDEVLPPTWSHGNPVDIIGDAPGERYAAALRVLLEDRGVDAVLVLNCPTAIASAVEAAHAVAEVARKKPRSTVLTSWVGSATAAEARRVFNEPRIPTYDTPEQAVFAFMDLVKYRHGQELLIETPPSIPEEFTPDTAAAHKLVRRVLDEGRSWMSEAEAKELLAAYGVPVVATATVATPEEAAARASDMPGKIALKILSPDITHKSDVGGVALSLDHADVQAAAEKMLARIRESHPDARIEGFTVQPMIRREDAFELFVGAVDDAQFGPVVVFGHGGTGVELIGDKALGLPPLNMHLAHELISGTRISKLLAGFRGRPPVDLDAIALILLRVSQLVIDLPQVDELDINPLLADARGVIALDARVKLSEAEGETTERLAIRPYPKELEETIQLGDGRSLLLRPIVPEDEPKLQAHFARLTPEEVRLRFLVPLKTMSHVVAARFTQLDYDREMALVVSEHAPPGEAEIHGVVRISADPDNERAEYAIIVSRRMTGMGLGPLLMRRIIEYAKRRGIRQIWGDVLRENKTMRKLCEVLGFEVSTDPDEPEIVKVTLDLTKG